MKITTQDITHNRLFDSSLETFQLIELSQSSWTYVKELKKNKQRSISNFFYTKEQMAEFLNIYRASPIPSN